MKYEYWLADLNGIPLSKKILLRKCVKAAEELYYMEETQMRKFEFLDEGERNTIQQARKQRDPGAEYDAMVKKGIRFVPWFSDEYPKCLKEIADYPYALYVKGSLPDEKSRRAAVIGARRCTPYGEKYAVEFARTLAGMGVEIISGMARGIDGMGHRGALLGGGRTYAVLGCGVDVCYPKEHIGLYVDILEQGGGILSEFPPGTAPLGRHFPARNRIISGLADAVLVMEAGRKSGSLITVDMALDQGRDVYALPGPVNSPLSDGCNRLIRQGAGILLSPESLAEEWGLSGKGVQPGGKAPAKKDGKNEKVLETKEKLVYSCLGLYPKGVDQVAAETKLDIKDVMELLVTLELEGYIREISKNQYIIARC
ncbi:MAG TPA: DNA-processing protein DprA [Candidatus Mediterraneibacter caccavium]|uniref:DNA-processing protein DprA n=1 Tax=Candidatus Mediterraneibacter caccavium TaxID=2838661 RepID=A0A9D2ATN6_9FIRM|nr:DNA-processing protein DprA [Candidatus Mediterraneibacter caccavium]